MTCLGAVKVGTPCVRHSHGEEFEVTAVQPAGLLEGTWGGDMMVVVAGGERHFS